MHIDSSDRVSRKNCIALFVINLLVLLIVYGRLLGQHFSPDFFAVQVKGVSELPHHIRNGRIVYGIVYYIVQSLGLSVTTYASAYTFLFMCIAAFCVMRMSTVLCSAVGQNNIVKNLMCSFVLLISVINVSITEWYLFLECMLMYALALLFASEGALVFSRRDWSLVKKAAVSFAALFISINCYQAALSWYITLALVCVVAAADFKLNRESAVGGFTVMVVGGINAVLNQLIVRMASMLEFVGVPGRQASFSWKDFIVNALKSIPTQIGFLRNGYSLLPEYFLVIAFGVGVLLLLISIQRKRKDIAWWRQASFVLFVLAVGYAFVYVPHFASNYMVIAPRAIAGLFLVLGMIFALALLLGTRWTNCINIICVAGILAVNCIHISQIIDDHLLTSRRDLAEAEGIVEAIYAHEQTGGETIEQVCVIQDRIPNYYYPDTKKRVMDINLRQIVVEWEQVNILTALSGRTFEHTFVSEEEAAAVVQGRNWNEFIPEEQLVFDGNRLYIISH